MEERILYLENVHTVKVDLDVADEETQQWVMDEIKRQGKEGQVELIFWRSSEGGPPPSSREGIDGTYEREDPLRRGREW